MKCTSTLTPAGLTAAGRWATMRLVLAGIPEYRVTARNTSTHSSNKIHDDAVARQYGFRGGLVPGATVYAYMTRPLLAAFGREWMERGTGSVRFLRPIYEGEEIALLASVQHADPAALEIRAL